MEGDWPEVGSAIRVRYSVVPGLTMTLRQEVVAHEQGFFIEFEDRSLRHLWIDSPRLVFAPGPVEYSEARWRKSASFKENLTGRD